MKNAFFFSMIASHPSLWSFAYELLASRFSVSPNGVVDENGQVRRNVEDPEIIRFCHKNGWLLVTTDHEMKNTHYGEIKKTDIAILASAHNSAKDQDEWVIALINLKTRILREFKNRQRPWFGTFSRTAKLKINTIK